MKRHRSLVAAFLALAVLVLVAPAAWAQYPPTNATVGVSDSTVAQGGTTTVSGKNWLAGSTVALALFAGGCASTTGSGESLGSARVGASGAFAKTVTLDVSPGTFGIEVSGRNAAGDQATECVSVQVLVAATGGVAATGANLLFGVMLMIAMAVIGAIALVAGRRAKVGVPE